MCCVVDYDPFDTIIQNKHNYLNLTRLYTNFAI